MAGCTRPSRRCSGATFGNSGSGFTGTGYVDYANATGDYVEFTVTAPSAGAYSLAFRYANGSTSDRPLELKVNGTVVNAPLSFPATGGWGTYMSVTANATLAAGSNTVRLTAVGKSGGNLDSLSVAAGAPAPTGTFQAEDARRVGATFSSSNAGYIGGGYVDYTNATGDYVEFTVNAAAAGTYALDFRYANGSTSGRPLDLSVDGQVLTGRVPFAPTGAWTTWATATRTVQLGAGAHTVRVTSAGWNGPNLDCLTVKAASPPPAEVTLQAESALLSGPIASSGGTGFTGTGFADYQNGTGDFVEFSYDAPAAKNTSSSSATPTAAHPIGRWS